MTDAPHSPNPSGVAVVAIVCLAAVILPLSFSGGALATPAIGRDLGGSAVSLLWITNAFMLAFGSLLMMAGTLADQYGRKRVFMTGIGIFVTFSLALSFAPSVWAIDILRAAQGVGAAATLAGGSAAMAQEFEGRARVRAFSMLGTTFGIGLAFGPIVGGWLVQAFGWRSIFATSTIVGTMAMILGASRMRETHDPDAARLDVPGVLSFTAALALFTFGIIQAPALGWTNPLVVGLLSGAAFLFILFFIIETRTQRPMLDVSLFRYRRFLGVQLLPIATCYAYVVLLILLPLRFIGIEGQSEVDAGFLMLALSAPMLVIPSLAVTLTRWLPAGVISGAGLLVAAAGLLWLGRLGPTDGWHIIFPLLVIGSGAGFPWGLMDGLSITVVPKERAGMATGIFNTTKVASEGVALAIVSATLAGLSSLALRNIAQKSIPIDATQLRDIGQRLAAGDLEHVASHLARIPREWLLQSYLSAFHSLTYVLAAITGLSAVAAFLLLSKHAPTEVVLTPSDGSPKASIPKNPVPESLCTMQSNGHTIN